MSQTEHSESITRLERSAREPTPLPRRAMHVINNSMTIAVDASAATTQRALSRLDLAAPVLRAIEELGLDDRVTLRPGGLTWRQTGGRGPIDVDVELTVEPSEEDSSRLSLGTRFSVYDERARVRLLDVWALVGPVASTLAERAARTVKGYAERDTFDRDDVWVPELRAA